MQAMEGVAAGSTATLDLPTGLTYHNLSIKYSGITLAQMRIKVLANNKEIFNRTGAELDIENRFNGKPAANGILLLSFLRENLRDRIQEELTALPTVGVGQSDGNYYITKLRIEIEIDAGAASPALQISAVQSPNYEKVTMNGKAFPVGAAGIILHRKSYPKDLIGGAAELANLPRGNVTNSLLNKITFVAPSGTAVSKLKLMRDDKVLFERDKATNNFHQANGKRVPQTASRHYAIDPSEKGYGIAPFDISRGFADVRFTIENDNGGKFLILTEYLGLLGD